MPRDIVVLDTSVVSRLTALEREDRQKIWDHVAKRWDYAISTMTIIELLSGMHLGCDCHWGDRRERFDVLMEPSADSEILIVPHEYVVQHLFGEEPTRGYAERDIRNWVNVIRSAVSRYALKRVEVDGELRTFQLESVHQDSQVASRKFIESMHRWRGWKRSKASLVFDVMGQEWAQHYPSDGVPPHRVWAAVLADQKKIEPNETNAEAIERVTSASYQYYCSMWRLAGQSWNYERDTSAWADSEQLLYLCDPRVHIVYLDKDYVKRTIGSSQVDRLLFFGDLAKAAGL